MRPALRQVPSGTISNTCRGALSGCSGSGDRGCCRSGHDGFRGSGERVPATGASFVSGNSSSARSASRSRASSCGNDSPTHSSACFSPSSANLAVLSGCLASSGCCNIKTRVPFETAQTCSQRQCDSGLAQRLQLPRGGFGWVDIHPFYERSALHRCHWRRQV